MLDDAVINLAAVHVFTPHQPFDNAFSNLDPVLLMPVPVRDDIDVTLYTLLCTSAGLDLRRLVTVGRTASLRVLSMPSLLIFKSDGGLTCRKHLPSCI